VAGIANIPSARAGQKIPTIAVGILAAVSVSHLINDILQSLIPAVYPILKVSYQLNFAQIGLITLVGQLTASLLQPLVGLYADRRPVYFALPAGMGFSIGGLILLSIAPGFRAILLSVGLVGVGSAVFHPEASRIARMASGGRHGLAQSLFALGGSGGSSLGPLLAAFIVLPQGQRSIAWFSGGALLAMLLLTRVSAWYKMRSATRGARPSPPKSRAATSGRRVGRAMAVLMALTFSKFFYLASIGSYYTFYLIDKFHVSIQVAQMYLFAFLLAAALGTLVGGHLGDRFGRKLVIWISILGAAPFTLLLPHVGLFWTGVLSVVVGLILSSAFPAILVYGQELLPGRVGMIAGLFFGLAFGMGGIGSAILGHLADRTSIGFVFLVCSFLPLIGLLTGFLPGRSAANEHFRPEP